MAGNLLRVEECGGGLLRLTLNRPRQHNALSFALLEELRACLENYAKDAALKCVVITGAGDKSFCAGGDLLSSKSRASMPFAISRYRWLRRSLDAMRSLEQAREISRIGRRALDAVRYFPVPVAAALNGAALGGGAELALACDTCLAAPHARLGLVQARLNLMTAWGGAADVIARCGSATGLALLLEAKQLTAREALQAGLIDKGCEEGQTIEQLAQSWSALMAERSAAVLRGHKALAVIARRRLHEALAVAEEQHMRGQCLDGPGTLGGRAAQFCRQTGLVSCQK